VVLRADVNCARVRRGYNFLALRKPGREWANLRPMFRESQTTAALHGKAQLPSKSPPVTDGPVELEANRSVVLLQGYFSLVTIFFATAELSLSAFHTTSRNDFDSLRTIRMESEVPDVALGSPPGNGEVMKTPCRLRLSPQLSSLHHTTKP
jgi:hypothetical protein